LLQDDTIGSPCAARREAGVAYIESCRRILDDVREAERVASGEFARPRAISSSPRLADLERRRAFNHAARPAHHQYGGIRY